MNRTQLESELDSPINNSESLFITPAGHPSLQHMLFSNGIIGKIFHEIIIIYNSGISYASQIRDWDNQEWQESFEYKKMIITYLLHNHSNNFSI